MLPRPYRLPLEPGVRLVGRTHRTTSFTLITKPNSLTHPRFAVVIPKSAAKLSSHRHRLARQLHGLFLKEIGSLPPKDILIIVKGTDSRTVLSDFANYLSSIRIS